MNSYMLILHDKKMQQNNNKNLEKLLSKIVNKVDKFEKQVRELKEAIKTKIEEIQVDSDRLKKNYQKLKQRSPRKSFLLESFLELY